MDYEPKPQAFTPKNSDYEGISQHEDVYTRKKANSFWRIFPVLSLIVVYSFSIYTIVRFAQLIENPFTSIYSGAYFFIIGGSILALLMFPLYLGMIYLLRNVIKWLYLGTPILSGGLAIAVGVLTQNIVLIVIGSVSLLFTLLVFWCLWADIKIALITIKTATAEFNKRKLKLFGQFFMVLLLTILSIGLYMIAAFNVISLAGFGNSNSMKPVVTSEEQSMLQIFVSVSAFFVLYYLEFLAAVSYLYGAAFFNQFSLAKAEQEETDFGKIAEEAYHIAFSSSLGTACVGALIMTIVSLVVNSAKQNSDDNKGDLGALLLYCIASIIGQLFEFLTAQAYVYSAFYGKGLCESGKMGLESFRTAGFDKFINFRLTSEMLNIFTFFISLLLALGIGFFIRMFGAGVFFKNNLTSDMEIVFSVLMGMFVIIILAVPFYSVNSMIGGSAAAQIGVFVEDPDRFRKAHPKAEKFEKYLRCQ
eukprot:GAHX01000518.1.p1 GENE.GAHX01000518.1~~GAHX01000518.1.p1  ORF type:complete len:492 (+),score=66.39 GAHX01000518.1:52-1476(+)